MRLLIFPSAILIFSLLAIGNYLLYNYTTPACVLSMRNSDQPALQQGSWINNLEAAIRSAGNGLFTKKNKYGIYYITYEKNSSIFVRQAAASATRARRLNPTILTAIATNYEGPLLNRFNFTIKIHDDHFNGARQWLTRVHYLTQTPFSLTLEIDSTTWICSRTLADDLSKEHERNSFDFATQIGTIAEAPDRRSRIPIRPHNFVFLYHWNRPTYLLLQEWFRIYKTRVDITDDQHTLAMALVSAEVPETVRVEKVKDKFAIGFISAGKFRFTRPAEGKISMIHSYIESFLPPPWQGKICEYLNANESRRQFFYSLEGAKYVETYTSTEDCLNAGYGKRCCYASGNENRDENMYQSLNSSEMWLRSMLDKNPCRP